jgi:hypothetical protein
MPELSPILSCFCPGIGPVDLHGGLSRFVLMHLGQQGQKKVGVATFIFHMQSDVGTLPVKIQHFCRRPRGQARECMSAK